MTDRDAFLARIRATPADEVARLVYADWCEEQGTDRELATAEFLRLTCGRPEPKRAKTKQCPDCLGWTETGHDLITGELVIEESELETCGACNGAGRVPNTGPFYRLFPKEAHEWLLANWRRLVPTLTADWGHPVVDVPGSHAASYLEGLGDLARGAPTLAAAVAASPRDATHLMPFEEWTKRGSLRCGVPFVLPARDRPGEDRVYTAVVRLAFDRGFVTWAGWRAPVLGEKIAAAVTEDQPLAEQDGPHARNVKEAAPCP